MALSWSEGKYGVLNGSSGDVNLFVITKGVTSRSRDDEQQYELHCSLPTFKSFFGYFPSIDSGKSRAERIMAAWCKKANLTGE